MEQSIEKLQEAHNLTCSELGQLEFDYLVKKAFILKKLDQIQIEYNKILESKKNKQLSLELPDLPKE